MLHLFQSHLRVIAAGCAAGTALRAARFEVSDDIFIQHCFYYCRLPASRPVGTRRRALGGTPAILPDRALGAVVGATTRWRGEARPIPLVPQPPPVLRSLRAAAHMPLAAPGPSPFACIKRLRACFAPAKSLKIANLMCASKAVENS